MIRNLLLIVIAILPACHNGSRAPVAPDAIKPVIVTEAVAHDTDDPAIWINPADRLKSLIIGTDKDTDGALYAFDLNGKIVHQVTGLKRPNNVDIAYGLPVNGVPTDIAVVAERESNRLRIFRMPDLQAIDNGGIPVFEGEAERSPMGIALYTRPSDRAIFAVVSRKSGPLQDYLWQYRLEDSGNGVKASLVRKFGAYSGKKEIEAIAVDNRLGYIYYADEQTGVRKYAADPDAGNNKELALFGNSGFASDHEGISIYAVTDSTGYLLVSNQQSNSFIVFKREGEKDHPHQHNLIAEVPFSTIESDGSDVTSLALGPQFPAGLFVAMSNGRVFHYYDWRDIAARIQAAPIQ